jgi:hypothetical protein
MTPFPRAAARKHKIANFDFAALVGAFDQARVAKPAMSTWSLSSAMLGFHLGGSDTAARSGDLAYQYGRNGNMANLSMSTAQAVLAEQQFGTGEQALQQGVALADLSPRLG